MSRRSNICDRVIGHLYYRAQSAKDRTEHELWGITLKLVGIARRGYVPTLDEAAYLSVGRSFEKWRAGNRERLDMMASEIARLVPDYDPNLEPAARVRRPEPFSGNLYSFEAPREDRPQKPEPLPSVSRGPKKENAG